MFINVDGAVLILHNFFIFGLLAVLFIFVEKYRLKIHVCPRVPGLIPIWIVLGSLVIVVQDGGD